MVDFNWWRGPMMLGWNLAVMGDKRRDRSFVLDLGKVDKTMSPEELRSMMRMLDVPFRDIQARPFRFFCQNELS